MSVGWQGSSGFALIWGEYRGSNVTSIEGSMMLNVKAALLQDPYGWAAHAWCLSAEGRRPQLAFNGDGDTPGAAH